MTAALPFPELVERAGARPGRGRRWWCPRCQGRTPALAVDEERELFYCHRCQWRGGRRTLERELGIEAQRTTPAERHRASLIRMEAERFTAWTRARRIATAELLRDLDGYEREWREAGRAELVSGQPVSERVWDKLEGITAWQGRAEARYWRLCDFDRTAQELYAEYVDRERAA